MNRDYNRDPNIKALKRKAVVQSRVYMKPTSTRRRWCGGLGSPSDGRPSWRSSQRGGLPRPSNVGVVLKLLVKEGPLGIHFRKKGIRTQQGTYIIAFFGTGILNNYHEVPFLVCYGFSENILPKKELHRRVWVGLGA